MGVLLGWCVAVRCIGLVERRGEEREVFEQKEKAPNPAARLCASPRDAGSGCDARLPGS
jgi:hypothetical protein